MTPEFLIKAEDQDITAKIADRLVSLSIIDAAGFESDELELDIDNRDGLVKLPRHGSRLAAFIGFKETELNDLGQYEVDEVELTGPSRRLIIRAHAAKFNTSGLKAKKSRPWHRATLGDLVSSIAAEHDLKAAVDPMLGAIDLGHIDQTEESDLHLLTRLSKIYGAVIKPGGGKLILAERGSAKTQSGRTMPPVALTAKSLTDWRVVIADRGRYGSVVAEYHDLNAAQRIKVRAGAGEPIHTIRRSFANEATARAAATAKLEAFQRGQSKLSATVNPGNPKLRAEARLHLEGCAAGVDGEWSIARAVHTINAKGYSTKIDAELPKKGRSR